MKTVCPNCHQKYDVPDDYLQQEVTCEKCQHDFFVTKAKICLQCGTANPQQIFECWKCNKSFASSAPLRVAARSTELHVPAPIPSVIPVEKEETVLDNISPWHKREVKALGLILGFLGPLAGIGLMVFSQNRLEIMVLGGIAVVFCYQWGNMLRQTLNPQSTLRWSWFEKGFVFLYLLGIIFAYIPFLAWNIVAGNDIFLVKALKLVICVYVVHCSFIAWKIYRARLDEQEEHNS